jgi:mxaJ protein
MLYGDVSPSQPAARDRGRGCLPPNRCRLGLGPVGGYFAHNESRSLRVTPIVPARDGILPMRFDISMGVRKGNTALCDRLNTSIVRDRDTVETILDAYHMPQVPSSHASFQSNEP